MAKTRSVVKIGGTISDVTFVDSKAYGSHARAKRGTYTPITLAEGMKQSAIHQKEANLLAKIIFDAVNEFVPGFKDGKFWPRLVSVFRQQKKAGKPYSYEFFRGKNIRTEYPMSNHGTFDVCHEADDQGALVKFVYSEVALSDYRVRILRIATDETCFNPYPVEVRELQLFKAKKDGMEVMRFPPLPENANLLYVLHCEQLYNGVPCGVLSVTSVSFLEVN